MGDSLIDADPSNPDGHFEDIETVRLHDRWLEARGSDWCHVGPVPGESAQSSFLQPLRSIVSRFDASGQNWGIKDPRASLFLGAWNRVLADGRFLMVYRHYASCYDSLRRRQARSLLINPSLDELDNRFWLQPEIALRSWLVHNKAMLNHFHQHPDRCLLVSQEAVVAGYSLITAVNQKFGTALNSKAETGVDCRKTRYQKQIEMSGASDALREELDETWEALQSMSAAIAEQYSHAVWACPQDSNADHGLEELQNGKSDLIANWDALSISTQDDDTELESSVAMVEPETTGKDVGQSQDRVCMNELLAGTDLNNRSGVRAILAGLSTDERVSFLQEALLQSDTPFLRGLLGMAYYNHGKPDEALPCLLLASSENDPAVWFHLGRSYLEKEQLEEACNAMVSAVEIAANADHMALLVRTLLKAGQVSRARYWCEKALAKHDGQMRFVLLLADCLVANDETDKALQWCDSNARIRPDSDLHIRQFQLLSRLGRKDEAQRCYDLASLARLRKVTGYRSKALSLLNAIAGAPATAEIIQIWNNELMRMKETTLTSRYGQSENRNTPRVAMSILVRDEVDIVGHNIRFHASQGVDHFIVTDNGSTDGTRELLAELQQLYSIDIIDEPSHTIDQDLWVTRMARQLQQQGGFDWVIHNDADEFWLPEQGSIPQAIVQALPVEQAERIGVLSCARHNMLTNRNDIAGGHYAFFNNVHAIMKTVSLLPGEQAWRDNDSNCIARTVMNKVLTRVDGLDSVSYGNHAAEHALDEIPCSRISVLHFPVRTYEQFEKKVINYGESLDRNDRLHAGSSLHLRHWYRQYLAGKLHTDYEQITFTAERLKELLDDGYVKVDDRLQQYFTADPSVEFANADDLRQRVA